MIIRKYAMITINDKGIKAIKLHNKNAVKIIGDFEAICCLLLPMI